MSPREEIGHESVEHEHFPGTGHEGFVWNGIRGPRPGEMVRGVASQSELHDRVLQLFLVHLFP